MHTIINSINFQNKIKGKYSSEYIESICEKLSVNPRIGKKFMAVNNVYKLDIGLTLNKKTEYSLVYYYQSKNTPVFIINIFKKKEKDILSKVINSLIVETDAI
ncbi:hypothetical protein [Flavivirga jejuensis]|uniref:Addiction module toxin RelE n=1 Tax=Flavivirga jejuensis TaxID=870487 RepID=A0ABT8WQI7_9FLAO|nr:hypothetical protein [Flavivirga jejuensis]MDO5975438.1 hypothetical protein [Flavivirga jejuensis]